MSRCCWCVSRCVIACLGVVGVCFRGLLCEGRCMGVCDGVGVCRGSRGCVGVVGVCVCVVLCGYVVLCV